MTEVTWHPGAAVRVVDLEGRAAGLTPPVATSEAPRTIRLSLQVGDGYCVVTVVEVSYHGRVRWERRSGTISLPVARHVLAAHGVPGYVQVVCEELASALI